MTPEQRTSGLRDVAKGLDRIDLPIYERFDRDPHQPVLGEGDPLCRVAFFGRDPGREEVRHQVPFIGAGGQKIRKQLHLAMHGFEQPDLEASLQVGRYAFWANTVPFKPLGNKPWSMAARRAARPFIVDLLVHGWRGRDVLTLGQNAFLWFGIDAPRPDRQRLQAHWKSPQRFEQPLPWELTAPDGTAKAFLLHALPHPSPLNATWYKRFDGMLAAKLRELGMRGDSWRVDKAATPRDLHSKEA